MNLVNKEYHKRTQEFALAGGCVNPGCSNDSRAEPFFCADQPVDE